MGFSINALKDEACHLLLGRQCQFDGSVTWNGRTNVYSLVLNNRKSNLWPQPLDAGTSSPSACLTMAEFEHELEGAEYCFAVMAYGYLAPPSDDKLLTPEANLYLRSLTIFSLRSSHQPSLLPGQFSTR